ncbi:hypothetical protein HYZ70_00325 [Candidatus Curtissbacteria bacterium]|nr:hypothetical protein [Candidatus Curtissbacteria bacterium]
MKNSRAFREFKVEKAYFDVLSKEEKQILPILKEAALILAQIYIEQKRNSNQNPGASFYPHQASDKEIKDACRKNPQILSPYTVVEYSEQDSQLLAVPYHLKYQKSLGKISKLLLKAATIVKNKPLSTYLKVASQGLVNGDYKAMDIAWLKTSGSALQFLIGPYERNLDKRFFVKMAYLAFFGIKDQFYTKKAQEFTKILFTTLGDKPHRYTSPSKIQICSLHNVIFSGFIAEALTSTEHIPSDDLTIKQAGSRLMGYLSTMDYKFDNLLYPIFNSIFEKKFRQSYSAELLRRGNYYLMLVYGLARQLHRYQGSRERLRELFPVFDETNSMVSGIQHSKHLVLKGVIDQRELEAMIIMHICWCFSEWVFAKVNPLRSDYLRGDALALNFYVRNEALKEIGGISWPNFSKIFFVIENLSTIFVRILSEKGYQQAQKFLRDNLSYEIFESFDSKLKKIRFPK